MALLLSFERTKKMALVSLACLVVTGNTYRLAPCEGEHLCGFERPEDLSLIPGSSLAVVSQSSSQQPLLLVDLQSSRQYSLLPFAGLQPSNNFIECEGPPAGLEVRGNAVARVDGEWMLYGINIAEKPRIEVFSISHDDPKSSQWTGCVSVPPDYQLNDVAVATDGTIYASHMFELPVEPSGLTTLRSNFMAKEPTGYAIRWTPKKGWTKVEGTDVSFANGVAVSADQKTLAVAGTFDEQVLLVERATGKVTYVPVPMQPDNVTPLEATDFLVAGHTGLPVTGVAGCRSPNAVPCGFPFAIVEVSSTGPARVVFMHDGSKLPGASVAIEYDQKLYLGSAFGDRISVVPTGTRNE